MRTLRKLIKKIDNNTLRPEDLIQQRETTPIHAGFITRTQIMNWDVVNNDDFIDRLCASYQAEAEKYVKRFPSAIKSDQIKHWNERIMAMRAQIKHIRQDSSLNPEEKKNKIVRRLEIILDDRDSISRAIEYLKHRADELQALRVRSQKTK